MPGQDRASPLHAAGGSTPAHGRHRSLDRGFHGGGFAGVRHGAHNGGGLHDLPDRHGNRLPGNVRQRLKPPLAQLLPPAGFIEVNDDIRRFRLEIRGRIVEGQVSILADAHKGHVDRMLRDQSADTLAFGLQIRCAVEQLKRRGGSGSRLKSRSQR